MKKQMKRTFDGCGFRLLLPKLQTKDGSFFVHQTIVKNFQSEDFMYNMKSAFKNKRGELFTALVHPGAGRLRAMERREYSLIFGAQAGGWPGGQLIVQIFNGTAREKTQVLYEIETENKIRIQSVQTKEMSAAEWASFVIPFAGKNKPEMSVSRACVKVSAKNENFQDASEIIARYINALETEIQYIRGRHEERYEITMGGALAVESGRFVYRFNINDPVRLAENTPVMIEISDSVQKGEVLECRGDQVTVVTGKSLGKSLCQGSLTAQSWKVLEALVKRLKWIQNHISQTSPIGRFLLEGPKLAFTAGSNFHIRKGQEAALDFSLTHPVSVIWGPPGTGKTYTMAKLALEGVHRGMKVLMVSHSNIAVDSAVLKTAQLLLNSPQINLPSRSCKTGLLPQGNLLRYGYVKSEALKQMPSICAQNCVLEQMPELQKQEHEITAYLQMLVQCGQDESAEYLKYKNLQKQLNDSIKSYEKALVEKAEIVGTTVSKLTMDPVFDGLTYDMVIFDEVSMAYVPQIIAAGEKATAHLICIGDFKQLPPIAVSAASTVLEKDIFYFLKIWDGTGTAGHPWMTMLDIQYRMHPDLADFASRHMYACMLKTALPVKLSASEKLKNLPWSSSAMVSIDLSGMDCACGFTKSGSRFNMMSGFISLACAMEMSLNGENSVGIITPYAAQARLIHRMIEDLGLKCLPSGEDSGIFCATIHQYQGAENDIIILDTVDCFPMQRPGRLLNSENTQRLNRLINVAVTRAKSRLVLVYCKNFWDQIQAQSVRTIGMDGTTGEKRRENLLYSLMDHILNGGKLVTKTQLCNFLENGRVMNNMAFWIHKKNGDFTLMTDWRQAMDVMQADIAAAETEILYGLPAGKFYQGSQEIFEKLKLSHKKGVVVRGIKSVFPVMVIDRHMTWYGCWQMDRFFEYKDREYPVTQWLGIRFDGRSLAKEVCTLVGLAAASNVDSAPVHDLKSFLEAHYRCPKCQAAITLKKKNKFFVGCTRCHYRNFVRGDVVSEYIRRHDIRCPIHHTPLEVCFEAGEMKVLCAQDHPVELDKI